MTEYRAMGVAKKGKEERDGGMNIRREKKGRGGVVDAIREKEWARRRQESRVQLFTFFNFHSENFKHPQNSSNTLSDTFITCITPHTSHLQVMEVIKIITLPAATPKGRVSKKSMKAKQKVIIK